MSSVYSVRRGSACSPSVRRRAESPHAPPSLRAWLHLQKVTLVWLLTKSVATSALETMPGHIQIQAPEQFTKRCDA